MVSGGRYEWERAERDSQVGPQDRITTASAEQLPQELPSTASPLPLIGLLGSLAIAASFGLKAIRKLAM